ncbi:hypothetical protein [Lysinibacillus fusiformis]|uniref:hypothetical protein n=1 Tax=Lysinibacillus fusiformis TaxID=28031 RepID=UPI00366516F9
MLQNVKEKIENIKERPISQEVGVKFIRTLGGHSTIIGISLVISIFVSHFLKQNWIKFYSLLKEVVDLSNAILMLIALAFIVYGIALIANFGTKEKLMRNNGLTNGKIIMFQIYKQLPYFVVTTIIWFYIKIILDNKTVWITNNFLMVIIMNALVIYLLLVVSVKLILNSYKIFNNSVEDSKDRLTIIITICATMISAIALFK